MRDNQRCKGPAKAKLWDFAAVKKRVWKEVAPDIDGWASKTSVGILLMQVHKWSHHLLKLSLYKWDLWLALDPESRRATMSDFFVRPSKSPSSVGVNGHATTPDDLQSRSPHLARFMCDLVWGDGSPREGSSLIIYAEGGQYKVCLSERNDDLSLWATSKTFEGILDVLEARLTDDPIDWRPARNRGKKR